MKPNTAKVKYGTERLTGTVEGTISACAIELFCMSMASGDKSAADIRDQTLRIMQDHHKNLIKRGF